MTIHNHVCIHTKICTYIINIFQTFVECILSINLKPPQYFMSGPICFDFWYLPRSDLAIICCDGIWIWPWTHQPSSGSVSTDPWHQEPLPGHDDSPAPGPGLAWASLSDCDWPQSLLSAALRRQGPDTSLSSVSGPESCSGNSVSAENASWFCFVSIDCQ